MKTTRTTGPTMCKHPPERLYTWFAYDGTIQICCCDCGKVLMSGIDLKKQNITNT